MYQPVKMPLNNILLAHKKRRPSMYWKKSRRFNDESPCGSVDSKPAIDGDTVQRYNDTLRKNEEKKWNLYSMSNRGWSA
jgi:hypothetical protein